MSGVRDLIDEESRVVFTIDQEQTVADAVARMAEHRIGSLIVLANGCPKGVFTERDVLKAWVERTAVDDTRFRQIPLYEMMTEDPAVAEPGDSLEYVISVMTSEHIRHLPIVEGGEVIAVLSMRDVVRSFVSNLKVEMHHLREYLGGGGYWSAMRSGPSAERGWAKARRKQGGVPSVEDVIGNRRREVFTIEQERSVAEAVQEMAGRGVGFLMVLAAGRPAGVFTERDVLRVWVERTGVSDTRFRDIRLAEVMTLDPIVVEPTDSLEYVMSVMTRKRIRHLPVVDEGAVVGIISIRDVVHSLVTDLKVRVHHLREYLSPGA